MLKDDNSTVGQYSDKISYQLLFHHEKVLNKKLHTQIYNKEKRMQPEYSSRLPLCHSLMENRETDLAGVRDK